MSAPLPDRAAVASLLVQALPGLSDRQVAAVDLQLVRSGGNNRLFRAELPGARWALKQYFRDASDPRDRLAVEFAFATHAWRHGVRDIPDPLAKDDTAGLGLYEWVDGVALKPASVSQSDVQASARFWVALNVAASREGGTTLPDASEARFSIEAQMDLVAKRVSRLVNATPAPEVAIAAQAVIERVVATWTRVQTSVQAAASGLGLSVEQNIPAALRCLSPSDFGFHNALRRADGTLCFLDFEYAGWDDPAKTFGDFFAHPGVAVSREHWLSFWEVAMEIWPVPQREVVRQRAELLEPVFRLKWACIVLNELLPDAARRRDFAETRAATDRGAKQGQQIEKAHHLLDTV